MIKKDYYIADKLFFHQRGDRYLVVSRTPPAWTIVNSAGYAIISKLPMHNKRFNSMQLLHQIDGDLSIDDLDCFLEKLASAHILFQGDTTPFVQPNRKIRIGGAYIELTAQCNLHCKHCYVSAGLNASDNLLTKDDILNAIYQIEPPAEIGFSGGEPLLRDDCLPMVREVVAKGYRCSLLTNGTLIDDSIAEELSALGVTVQISLEGATAEVNDQIRGKGSFARIVKSIETLVKHRVNVRVSFTPTASNFRDFNSFLDFVKAQGVQSIHVCTFTPQGRGETNSNELMMTTNELLEFQSVVFDASKNFDIAGNLPETLDTSTVGYMWDKCPLAGSIHIGYDGSIYPCEIAAVNKMIIGNIKTDRLSDALNSERAKVFIQNSRQRIELIGECKECEWKHFCGGGCMVLSLAQNDEINTTDYLCACRKEWFERILWSKIPCQ